MTSTEGQTVTVTATGTVRCSETQNSRNVWSKMGARQPHADAKVERDMLLVALSRCKTNLAVCKRRSAAFWARISAYAKDEQLLCSDLDGKY